MVAATARSGSQGQRVVAGLVENVAGRWSGPMTANLEGKGRPVELGCEGGQWNWTVVELTTSREAVVQ